MVKLRFSARPDSTIRAREVEVLHSLRPRALLNSLQVNHPGGTTSVTYTDRSPINWDALVEYAKITAVGTFVGIPVGLALGYLAGRGGRSKVAANGRRRRRAR